MLLGRGPLPAVLWPLLAPGSGEEEAGPFSSVGPPPGPLLEVFFSVFDLGTVWFWLGRELEGCPILLNLLNMVSTERWTE